MLSSARNFGSQGLPILGVNLGKLGFLSDIPPEEISQGLADILSGQYEEDDRIFLRASINEERDTKIALNEIVIHSGTCLLYTSPSPRDGLLSRMPSSA